MKRLGERSIQWIIGLLKTIGLFVRGNAVSFWRGVNSVWGWIKQQVLQFLLNFKERYRELFKRSPLAQLPLDTPAPDSGKELPLPESGSVEENKMPEPPPTTLASGRGIWIWRLVQAEDGHLQQIIDRAQQAGLDWIAIKGGDGTSHWVQLTGELVRKIKEAGIKVFGWVYTYGNNPRNEAEVAKEIFRLGCDGLIVDAEKEYEGRPAAAEEYMSIIRSSFPEAFIAYSTFPIISKHSAFPYREFGKYCNVVMPQCYWKMIGETPETMFRRLRVEWSAWEALMQANGDDNSIVPIFPVGQAFGASPEEVGQFLTSTVGFGGISLWSWPDMNPMLWEAYSK